MHRGSQFRAVPPGRNLDRHALNEHPCGPAIVAELWWLVHQPGHSSSSVEIISGLGEITEGISDSGCAGIVILNAGFHASYSLDSLKGLYNV